MVLINTLLKSIVLWEKNLFIIKIIQTLLSDFLKKISFKKWPSFLPNESLATENDQFHFEFFFNGKKE